MQGWSPKDQTLLPGQEVDASTTKDPISREFALYSGGAVQGLVIKIKASGVTAADGITAMLQTGTGGDWENSKTVSIDGNGAFYIKLLAANTSDQAFMPLLARGRVVVTTGTGDALTVDSVEVLQET